MINVLDYVRPITIDEAIERMAADEFIPIAGGTDLIPQLRRGNGCRLLDIGGLNLDFIRDNDEWIEIGAGTTHTEIHESKLVKDNLPLVGRACGLIGSIQIRNRGTLGGNIANASPCADSVPALLVYDAEIKLASRAGERRINLAEFIKGPYRTNRRPDELIISILCRKHAPATGGAFLKLGRRQAVNISRMSLAAIIKIGENSIIESARVSAGSVFPVPSRIQEVEIMLSGAAVSPELFRKAGEVAAESMIAKSGRRWSTPYKEPVLIGLTQRALTMAAGF